MDETFDGSLTCMEERDLPWHSGPTSANGLNHLVVHGRDAEEGLQQDLRQKSLAGGCAGLSD